MFALYSNVALPWMFVKLVPMTPFRDCIKTMDVAERIVANAALVAD